MDEEKYYTHTSFGDGFGSQYQKIVETYIYCKLNNLEYLYKPLTGSAHNYDNDPSYVSKLENLINLKCNLSNVLNRSVEILTYHINVQKYSEKNIDLMCNSKHMTFIKKCFWENKDKNYFNNNKLNIAVHIRRPNCKDNRKQGTDTNDSYYIDKINLIREEYKSDNLLFHIYSQGNIENFKLYENDDTILHIDQNIVDTFMGLVSADILVTSGSSFSYIAALISDGMIYYKKFWHPPRKEWLVFN